MHYKGAVREKQDPAVILSDIDTFLNNGKLRLRAYKKRLPHSQTVDIARAHLKKKGYSLVFNNCEHFATYCVTGRKKSRQVRRLLGSMATLSLAVTGLIIQKKAGARKQTPPAPRKTAKKETA